MGMGSDCIANVPLLPSCCCFLFVFGYRISFFDRFQSFCWWLYSAVNCDFSIFVRGGEPKSSYPAILPPAPITNLLLWKNPKTWTGDFIQGTAFWRDRNRPAVHWIIISSVRDTSCSSPCLLVLHSIHFLAHFMKRKGIMEMFWRIVEGTSECKPINPCSWTIQFCLAYNFLGSNWAVFPLLSLHPEIMWQGSSKTVCASFSVMPATNWLLHSPPRLWNSPSVLIDLPDSEGTLWVWDPSISNRKDLCSLPGAQVPFQFFLFFLLSYQVMWRLYFSFRSLRSSVIIQ